MRRAENYWAPTRQLLTLAPLSVAELLVVLVASTLGFWTIEAEKLVLRRLAGDRPGTPAARPDPGGPST